VFYSAGEAGSQISYNLYALIPSDIISLMERSGEQKIRGLTGEVGGDGLLTPDLQTLLDQKQYEAAQTVLDHLERREVGSHFPIAAMATGIGKTRVEHEVIERWRSRNPGARVLFIAGTKLTLVQQAHAALIRYQEESNGGVDYVDYTESEELERDTTETEDVEEVLEIEQEDLPFYRVGRFKDKDVDVRVATIQTIQSAYKRGQLDPAEFDLVIVDEVHNIGTAQRASAVCQFPNVIGFTATPHRHSGQMKRPEQYGFEVAYNFPLPEAQESRLLPPLLGMQINTTGLVEEIPTKLNGQIDYRKLEQILKKSPELRPFIADKVANIIRDGEKEYKTVVAVNFVWEAQELAQLLNAKGIKVGVAVNQQAARQIHNEEIPALDTIERYKLAQSDPRSIQVLISPYVASEGFDAPFTEVLVWASPTDSDLRYTQYVGRLARRFEGKLFGLNLDFLYQTNQYGWSYNMGMWMKGSVRQLPSGLLYLGPEQDIAGLTELDVVQNIRRKGDSVDISDLGKGLLIDVIAGEIPLSHAGLTEVFRGGFEKLSPLALQVKTRMETEHPEYFSKRRSGPNVISIVTLEGKQAFIEEMLAAGIALQDKDIQELKDTDMALTWESVKLVFIGDGTRLSLRVKEVKERLESEYPEYFKKRMNGSFIVDAVTFEGRQIFINAMVAAGEKLKDTTIQQVREADLPLTQSILHLIFTGRESRLSSIALQVKARLEQEHPEYFEKRKNISKIIDVVTAEGRQSFIEAMIIAGVKLKEKK